MADLQPQLQTFPVDASGGPTYARRFTAQHHGTDVFADLGTPLYAVADGRARKAEDPLGGHVVYLETPDGWLYYYAHLDTFAPGPWPRQVKAGDQLGTVGTTGNAEGKEPHLHFQIRRTDGQPIDPFDALAGASNKPVLVRKRSRAPGNQPRRQPRAKPLVSVSSVPPWLWLLGLWWLAERRRA